jgi:hypothetical protein
MNNTIWRLNATNFFDLKLVDNSRELMVNIDIEKFNSSGNDGLITFGVVPVLELQGSEMAWSIRQAKGRIQGIGASVSGPGTYAHINGSFSFSTKTLESSKTYQELKQAYNFYAGITGFWGWIGLGSNAFYHKQELSQVFDELSQAPKNNGKISFDFYVTGLYPNIIVSASPYILAFEISSKIDNSLKFPVISSGSPAQDIGGRDENENILPTKGNRSTIEII